MRSYALALFAVLCLCSGQATGATKMTTFAHLSDLHFGRVVPEVAEAMINSLQALKPDFIIISGDLTQRASSGEFRKARDFLDRLPAPYLIVPGNHDLVAFNLLERFTVPWGKWRRYVASELEPIMQTDGAVIKGINTARRFGDDLDWSRGGVNAEQLIAVGAALERAETDQLRMLVAHHPFWLPESHAHRGLIDGRDEALPHLRKAGVDLILSGHIHMAFAHVLDGMIISHAGTGTSNRLLPEYPNSFNVVRGDRHQLSITLMEWHEDAFAEAGKEWFSRKEGGWEHGETVHDQAVNANFGQ